MSGRFEAFGTSHYLVLALFMVGAVVIVWLGRRVRHSALELRARRAFAVAIVVVALPMQILQFLPGDWDLATSLPLQLCDLACIMSVYALWTRRPWAAALTYYWGLTLTTQAMITPALSQDFPNPRFIGFWAMHAFVVWAALYLTFGLGIRPTWQLFRFTVLTTSAYAALVMLFNFGVGTNYGYLNRKPSSASILDILGPWPGYVLAEIAIVTVVWALITWPWIVARTPTVIPATPTAKHVSAIKPSEAAQASAEEAS